MGPLEAMAGGWVLLARLINSRLRRELRRTGDVATAAEVVGGLLADEGITALDAANETSRARAVDATLTVSLDALNQASRQRFETLAIFPEDTPIPAEVLARVWQRSPAATRGLLADLADDHLVQDFDPHAGTVRLHDVVRRWLRRRLAGERLRALNDQLLEATRPQSTRWSDLPETDTYLWRWAGWHLAEAGRTAELAGTVRSIDYLARKTHWLGPAAVETDLGLAATLLPDLDPLARRYQADRAPVHPDRRPSPGRGERLRPPRRPHQAGVDHPAAVPKTRPTLAPARHRSTTRTRLRPRRIRGGPGLGPRRQAGQRRLRQGADLAGGRRPAPGARPRRIRGGSGLGP